MILSGNPNPSLLSPQGPCWAHPGLFPVMLLCPSGPLRAVRLQSNALSQSQQVLGSPAQPSPCPLANSAGYARPSCAGYTWQPQFPAIMRLGAAGAIPTSGRPASLVDIVQSSPSFKTQKIMWSSSTIISLCKEHEECVVG